MPDSIDSLSSRVKTLELTVGSFDFRITSIQLTLNQLEAKIKTMPIDQMKIDIEALKHEVVTVTDDAVTLTLADYLNGKEIEVMG